MTATPGRLPTADPKPVSRRHGKSGFVRVMCDMDPAHREALIELAWEKRTSLSDQIRLATIKHLVAEGKL